AADKRQLKRCRQFLNYYLPTTIRLLEQYVRLQELHLQDGENVAEAMEKIRGAIAAIRKSFHRQLDSLFARDVVDITAEISVMEQMLQRQGLADDDFTDKEK